MHLQSISERDLSDRACLLEERMVCLTAERGWNTEGGNDFQNKETGSRSRNRSTSLRLLSHYFKLLY